MKSTVGEVLSGIQQQLQQVTDTPRLDAECLLMAVLACSRTWLFAHTDAILTAEHRSALEAFVNRRLAGEPIAYILQRKSFYQLELEVTPDVLIPRPETECLVDFVLSEYSDSARCVLDLGTGSGAIALSLAHARPNWRVLAVDTSACALAVARRNAERCGCPQVEFLRSDWFSAVKARVFDIIVANPPYIADNDEHLLALQYEPQTALTAGVDGMRDVKRILAEAVDYLSETGVLVVEHGYDQADAVVEYALRCGYRQALKHQDLAGNFRFVVCYPG